MSEVSLKSIQEGFSYKTTLMYLILAGVLLSVVPGFVFSSIQTYVQSFSVGADPFSLDLIIMQGLFFGLFSLPYIMMLYLIFRKLLSSIYLTNEKEIQKAVIKYRRYFQLIYVPFMFVNSFIFLFLYYLVVETLDIANLIAIIMTSIYLPAIFGPPAFILMEYILDRTLAPIISTTLDNNEIVFFPTLTTNQKNLFTGSALLIGFLIFTSNLILTHKEREISEPDIIVLSVLFIFAISSHLLIYRTTNPRMNEILKYMAKTTSSSDTKYEALEIKSFDDIGNLVQMHNATIQKLSSTIGAVGTITANVVISADGVSSIAQEVNTISEEISIAIQNISKGAAKQSEASSIAITDVKEMSESLDDLIKNVETALAVIQDISDQTNILALNAAIEAARAGQYGRGFAVVADNVRRLAEETKSNTSDIQKLMNDIVTNMGEGIIRFQESLETFASHSEEFSASSEEVAASTEEQIASLHHLNQNTQNLNKLVKELAAAFKV